MCSLLLVQQNFHHSNDQIQNHKEDLATNSMEAMDMEVSQVFDNQILLSSKTKTASQGNT